ncbi:MAG: DUF4147 domain-containing protein [bacterium]|nr:DUF4147 domain-containing protein [bacterium]
MGLVGDCFQSLRTDHPVATQRLLKAADAALEAVEPIGLVRSVLAVTDGGVTVNGHFCSVPSGRVVVLAVGKAALGMSRGASEALGGMIARGLVISDQDGPAPEWGRTIVGGHPIPDEGSLRGAEQAIRLARGVGPDEILLALVSGGGSALMEAPVEGLGFSDLQNLNDRLVRSGVPIEKINQVRRVVSKVKGGKLAALSRGPVITLVISDVGDDPAVVASGPTVPAGPSSTPVGEILDRYSIKGRTAEKIRQTATHHQPPDGTGRAGRRADQDMARILATAETAGEAAIRHLQSEGLSVASHPHPLFGDAEKAVRKALADTPEGSVRILSGETTVKVRGKGRGGRNQHAALAAGLAISGTDYRFLAFGTDGVDGPTDAAGGMVDGATVCDPAQAREHLRNNDSYTYLEAAGALLRTGRTGTNVADLWIVDKSQDDNPERIVIS